jgi:hypothetical protein
MDAPFPPEMMGSIKKFFEEIHPTLSPGYDRYDPVFESQLFYPLQRRYELELMIRTARTIRPYSVMEIGADKGGGLYHWCHCLPTVRKVIGCEIRGTPYRDLFKHNFPNKSFFWGECDSRSPAFLSCVGTFLGSDGLDVLFIDGDKTKMVEDFDAYRPLMSRGGLVFIHDVQDREPKQAFLEIAGRGYHHEVIIDTSEVAPTLEREKAGIPPANPYEGWLRHWHGRSCGVGVIYMPTD